jgi:hypothetical protein
VNVGVRCPYPMLGPTAGCTSIHSWLALRQASCAHAHTNETQKKNEDGNHEDMNSAPWMVVLVLSVPSTP